MRALTRSRACANAHTNYHQNIYSAPLSIYPGAAPGHCYIHTYTIGDQEIAKVKTATYLGVFISENLSWNSHVEQIRNKAARTLSLIRRTLGTRDRQVKEIAFNQLVRPQLEYASCLWNPWTDRNVQMVENIQRQAARFAISDFRRESSVTSMLNTLRWNTLQQRRILFQAEMLHKIHHGIVNIRFPQHITPVPSFHHLRTHRLSYHQPKYRIDCYLYSFYSRPITHSDDNKYPEFQGSGLA